MAGGCLATAFTWFQHHGVVLALSMSPNEALRAEVLDDLIAGRTRGGVAVAGVLADPPLMTAEQVDGGWRLDGAAPFVSGWGIIDQLQLSAVDVASGDVVAALVPAREQPGLTDVRRLSLVAADATATVGFRVDSLIVPDDRIVSRSPHEAILGAQVFGIRLNGGVPLGIVRRTARLLDEAGDAEVAAAFLAEADVVRGRLDAGMGDLGALLDARADASQLAVRATSALVASVGGSALERGRHAQRLAREAIFTLVASSRPPMRRTLVERFARG
jgi:hypothetical protein